MSEAEFLKSYQGDVFADSMSETEIERIFVQMSKIEGIEGFFNSMLRNDLYRFFNAMPEAQGAIRGARLRTLYFLKKVKSKEPAAKKKAPKLTSPHHA